MQCFLAKKRRQSLTSKNQINLQKNIFGFGFLCLLVMTSTGFAQSGDGSYSNNALLNSSSAGYSTPVEYMPLPLSTALPLPPVNQSRLSTLPVALLPPASSTSSHNAAPHGLAVVNPDTGIAENLALGVLHIERDLDNDLGVNLDTTPREPYHPFFDVDWSLGLAYTHTGGTQTGKNSVVLTPEISLTHQDLRGQYSFAGRASLSVNDDQLTRIDETEFSYSGQYALDSVTGILSGASIALSQDDVNAPGMADTIVQTPVVATLRGNIGIARQIGRFTFELGTQAQRQASSDTLLVGGLGQNNSDRNFSRLGGTLRTSYTFSPEISLYIEGGVAHDWYDRAPITTVQKLDGWDYTISTGAIVNWRDVLSAEASVGHTTRAYDDVGVVGMGSAVFGLNLAYTPNDALRAGLQFATNLMPANASSGQTASVDYSASGNITYGMTPWLDLRASGSVLYSLPQTGTNIQATYTAGAGADFAVNKNISVNLDYLYTWAQLLPVTAQYQHAGTIGIRIAR